MDILTTAIIFNKGWVLLNVSEELVPVNFVDGTIFGQIVGDSQEWCVSSLGLEDEDQQWSEIGSETTFSTTHCVMSCSSKTFRKWVAAVLRASVPSWAHAHKRKHSQTRVQKRDLFFAKTKSNLLLAFSKVGL